MPIDMVISPEKAVAHAIMERINAPGSFNIIPLVEGQLKLVSVLCHDDCPLLNTPMKQIYTLFPDLLFKIVAIIRGEEKIVPDHMDQLQPKDEVYFVVAKTIWHARWPLSGMRKRSAAHFDCRWR